MAYCERCERWFPHDRALQQHEDNSNSHWICNDCGLDFTSYNARREHYIQSPGHHYCRECDRHFNSEVSRMQHMDSQHWYCEAHDRVSTLYYHPFTITRCLLRRLATCRSLRMNMASWSTTDRAWPTNTALYAVRSVASGVRVLPVPLHVQHARPPQSIPEKPGPCRDIQALKHGLPHRVRHAQRVMPACRERVLWRADVQTGSRCDGQFDKGLSRDSLSGLEVSARGTGNIEKDGRTDWLFRFELSRMRSLFKTLSGNLKSPHLNFLPLFFLTHCITSRKYMYLISALS
jgi:hypothetical protein